MSSSSLLLLGFSELDAAQRARVAYLFADQLCGSDPHGFRYEVDEGGEIRGRVALDPQSVKPRKVQAAAFDLLPVPSPTPAEIARARQAFDALALIIYRRMKEAAYDESVPQLDRAHDRQGRSHAHHPGTVGDHRPGAAVSTLPHPQVKPLA